MRWRTISRANFCAATCASSNALTSARRCNRLACRRGGREAKKGRLLTLNGRSARRAHRTPVERPRGFYLQWIWYRASERESRGKTNFLSCSLFCRLSTVDCRPHSMLTQSRIAKRMDKPMMMMMVSERARARAQAEKRKEWRATKWRDLQELRYFAMLPTNNTKLCHLLPNRLCALLDLRPAGRLAHSLTGQKAGLQSVASRISGALASSRECAATLSSEAASWTGR